MLQSARSPFSEFDKFCNLQRPRSPCVQDCARKFCWGACRGGGIEAEDIYKDDLPLRDPYSPEV